MKTPSLKLPKFINKTTVLLIAGAVVFLSILAYGIVREVQAQRIETALAASERQKQEDTARELVSLKKSNTELQNALNFQTSKSASICDWVKTQAAAKRVVTPQLCKV